MTSSTLCAVPVVLSLLLAIVTMSSTTASEPAETYIDPFEGGLHIDWKVIREDKSHYSFDKNAGCLTIKTQRGTIHGDEENDALSEGRKAKNIFLFDKPIPNDADFDAVLAVKSFQPISNYHQVALILYKDDDNYVKWSMEHSWRDPGTNNLILVRESDSQPDHALIKPKSAPDDFWLKISRSGDQYVCSFSEDGDQYELIGFKHWEEDAGPGESRIGFLSKNGGDPDAEEIDTVIDSFELRVFAPK